MPNKDARASVPPQQEGSSADIVEVFTAESREEAASFFRKAREKLLDINNWEKITEGLSASFALMDANGDPKQNGLEPGDYFRIDIPGPGSSAGDGYDWVKVEIVEDCSDPGAVKEHIALRVRPTSNPSGTEETAHFFKDDATSSFIVSRDGNKVSAEIHGRNEKPNKDSEKAGDVVRNSLVGAGAIAAFGKIQWSKLAKALIRN